MVAAGLKDVKKANQLLGTLTKGEFKKSLSAPDGGVEIFVKDVGPSGSIAFCMIEKPNPLLLVAMGNDALAMLAEVIKSPTPTEDAAAYRAAWQNDAEHWISQGFLDLSPAVKGYRKLLGVDGPLRLSFYLKVDEEGLMASTKGTPAVTLSQAVHGLSIIVPNFIKARAQGQATACMSNLKNIGTALEMYCTDNAGLYPSHLDSSLTPAYIKRIPLCPGGTQDSYGPAYQPSQDHKGYTVFCQGEHHQKAGIPKHHPRYNPNTGLETGR